MDLPDLQSPCAEDTRPLVLGQVPGGYPDLVWLAFALLLRRCGRGLAVCHLLVTTSVAIGCVDLTGVLLAIWTGLFVVLGVFGQEVVSVVLFFRKQSIRVQNADGLRTNVSSVKLQQRSATHTLTR